MNILYYFKVSKKDIGVRKKIQNQIKSFEKSGHNIEKIDFEELKSSNNKFKNIKIFLNLKKLEYSTKDIIYIRYIFLNPFIINYFKFLKNLDKKIILEIPTYPYDKEIKKNKIIYFMDLFYREKLKKYIYKIVTYSNDEEIYGIKTIKIFNGINLEEIKLIDKKCVDEDEIIFTSVSNCSFWHGIDRFLFSLKEYEKVKDRIKVLFNIVGEGEETEKLKKIVSENSYLSEIVKFHGFKTSEDLDKIYNNTNICVGCLGNHRKGIYTVQALKNKEYMAKGLPMIFSEDDPGLRGERFVYRAIPDETILNIEHILKWYKELEISPLEIREKSRKFSWDIQINKIINQI